MSSSIKCGVCGAVRFYRFVKQTRKFGVQSCVSCRKFISKMIKCQACAKSTNSTPLVLQCVQGDGLCLIAPVVRNQEWNMLRCAYKTRCHSCWLKMCLKFYNIPASVRSGLNAMLPPLMRVGLDVDVQSKMAWPAEDSLEKNLFKSAVTWDNIHQGSTLSRKFDKYDYTISMSPNKKRKKVRKKMKNAVSPSFGQQTLRQRVEIRGPRVKHVCRSASVALGQPLATFPIVDGKDEAEKNVSKEDKSSKKEDSGKEKSIICNINVNSQPPMKRGKALQNTSSLNLSVTRSSTKAPLKSVYTISIDFWEQYDPSEVGSKGFALISSEQFHIPAICYLCGSAGKEPMIHCQCCCEPYHQFCLEPSEWNACSQPNWSCPRCTICQSCYIRSGPKLSCIRCRQSFHHSCLSKSGVSARLYSPDRPYVCQSCIKCKSCGSEGVSVHVGNLPLCSMCFKLRQRGNYCPLCQRCYNENDFDMKMMECNECSCWVHARCEGLSDERYQILSYLPDSIEFTCRQCSSTPNPVWRNAIESELKAGFIAVIKSLSKNRKARAALKWSPRKECLCRPVSSVRKLDFSDEKTEPSNAFNFRSDNEDNEAEPENPKRVLRRLRKMKNRESLSSQEDSSANESCSCSDQQVIARPSPTLMSVKRKVNGNDYGSLFQFHWDMEHVISRAGTSDLTETYHKTLQEVFPWFNVKQNLSSDSDALSTPTKEPSLKSSPEVEDSILDFWKEEILKVPKTANLYNIFVEDKRSCCLCKGLGDGQEAKESRLLYCGQNEYVHANCILWSNEVFEEIDGSLQNVHSAISRGRMIRCTECGKKGASIGCCYKNCGNTYHYPCARNIGLTFNEDKTLFCNQHSSKVQGEFDFSLKRPIYVEMDRKKKKFAEPDSVKVMIGSLTVDCLGSVMPGFSDGPDKIIPSGYRCSRLYWSTVNPSKIVRYYIRTFVQVCVPEVPSNVENNVTIDHSIERKLAESAIKQVLDSLVDSVCNKEVDENLAEQNNTDLLPPELKEAIFEDLPHDLLDGISMQDIFPKASYEDFLAMDLKNDDLLKDDILPDFVDDLFNAKSHKACVGRELKRSKSEIIPNSAHLAKHAQQQRSCSLTWSCKLDATMKRRKISRKASDAESLFHEIRIPESITLTVGKSRAIVQVDSAADPSSGEIIFKEKKFALIPQLDGAGDVSSDEECVLENQPVTCKRCQCTYRTQDSYNRHLGNCEIMTTSDSDSDIMDISSPSEGHALTYNRPDIQVISPLEASVPSPHLNLQIEPIGQALISPQIHAHATVETLHQTVLTTNDVIVQTQYTRTTTTMPNTAVLPQETPRKTKSLKSPRTPKVKPKIVKTYTRNTVPCERAFQNAPVMQAPAPPTVILQQMAPMSTYVEQQQPSQQSVQYIAAIGNQEAFKPQYSIVPGAYIQASSENLLALQNGGLAPQILQIAQPQPAVLGTVLGIQQQPAIQCGMISSEQLVLSSAPTLEMFTDSAGSMFVSSQPMYYGLETIVSNTVMSSSQFVAGHVPQVLASSYQTTTQVFQASKLMEPIVDVQVSPVPTMQNIPPVQPVQIPGNFLLLNQPQESMQNFVPVSQPAIPRVAVRPSPVVENKQATWPILGPINDGSRPYLDSKHVSENTSMIKSRIPPLPNHCIAQRTLNLEKCNQECASVPNSVVTSSSNVNLGSPINVPCQGVQNKVNNAPTSRPMNRVLPMQAVVAPKQNPVEKPIIIEEPTPEKCLEEEEIVKSIPWERKEKEKAAPLKIVLQKQIEDGSYKIAQAQEQKKSEDSQPLAMVHTTTLPLLPIKKFELKTSKSSNISKISPSTPTAMNIPKIKAPPIAVKKPRLQRSLQKPAKPSLMYEIKSQDGFTHTASSMSEVWEMVFQEVQNARKAHNMPLLPYNPLTENLGLDNNATIYLVEQLPNVNRCIKYKPKFHDLKAPKAGEGDGDLVSECDNGSSRAEPFKSRKVHDMFSWLASRHRQQPKMMSETELRRVASTNLPMAMRFRNLKETSKESVGVYHSHIHGRGLFCLRDIEAGEMVIEYAGEVIRSLLTDKREKYYDSKNIGCYMFKIDDHLVVDATMKGNAARFINHSCEPNCYSRVVDILGKKHILIFALRRIIQGEELTYDYKFPFEDIKIPCTCGSRRCRKYLN